jgi:hypothetical protein
MIEAQLLSPVAPDELDLRGTGIREGARGEGGRGMQAGST